jgi:hypothetical protein
MDHLELAISGDNYLRISSMLPEFASADKSLLEIFMRSSFPSAGSEGREQKTHSVFTVQVVKTEEEKHGGWQQSEATCTSISWSPVISSITSLRALSALLGTSAAKAACSNPERQVTVRQFHETTWDKA